MQGDFLHSLQELESCLAFSSWLETPMVRVGISLGQYR